MAAIQISQLALDGGQGRIPVTTILSSLSFIAPHAGFHEVFQIVRAVKGEGAGLDDGRGQGMVRLAPRFTRVNGSCGESIV